MPAVAMLSRASCTWSGSRSIVSTVASGAHWPPRQAPPARVRSNREKRYSRAARDGRWWRCGFSKTDRAPPPSELASARVIRALARDGNVVNVAFPQPGARNPHELGLVVELCEVLGADVTHRGAQSANELVHDIGNGAFIRHLPLDALRNELERVLDLLLKVTIGGAARHGTD